MWKHRIRRPSAALVVACLALLVALGGTSYATVLNVPKEQRRHATTQAQRRECGEACSERRAHRPRPERLAPRRGLQGGPDPAGAEGRQGDDGAPGVSCYELVVGRSDVTNQLFNSVAITCPTGKKAIGGGGATAGGIIPGDGPYIVVDQPSVNGSGWLVQTARATSGGSVLLGYAICATIP